MSNQPDTMTTSEAISYIQQHTGKTGKPYHRSQMQRWRRYGWLKVFKQGGQTERGQQNIYLVADLDVLIARLKVKHRHSFNPGHQGHKLYLSSPNSQVQSLPNTLTIKQWQNALNYFDGCCAACGRQLNDMFGEFKESADHWIPISYGGDDNPGTVASNIVPLCHGFGGCNNKKNNALPDAWLYREFGKRKANQITKRVQEYFDSIAKGTS